MGQGPGGVGRLSRLVVLELFTELPGSTMAQQE